MSKIRVNEIETLNGKGEGLISYPYEANLVIDSHNTVLREGDQEYKLAESVTLPYTTTGVGMPEGGAFVSVGDGTLRQQLADPSQGGDLVHVSTSTGEQPLVEALNQRVIHVNSLSELNNLPNPVDGALYEVASNGQYRRVGDGWKNTFKTASKPRVVRKPEGFDWPGNGGSQVYLNPPVITLGRSGYEVNRVDWAPPEMISSEQETFYVASAATGAGLTPESPGNLITLGFEGANAQVVIAEPGLYFFGDDWPVDIVSNQVNFKVAEGGCAYIITGTRSLGFDATSDPAVFISPGNAANVTSCVAVQERNEFGDFLGLVEYATVAELETADSGFATVTGDLYVKLPDGSEPDSTKLWVLWDFAGPTVTGGSRYYFEGFRFFGGAEAFKADAQSGTTVVFRDCHFAFSANQGLDADNMVGGVISRRCRAYSNRGDGFNYHDDNTGNTPCYGLEDHCIAYGNGLNNPNSPSTNASTNHDTSRVIRVGGVYESCVGPIVADINGSQSWNVGCVAANSLTTTGIESSWEAWDGDGSGGAQMWLDDCTGYGSTWDFYAHDGGKIYYRNPETDLKWFVEDGVDSVIDEY